MDLISLFSNLDSLPGTDYKITLWLRAHTQNGLDTFTMFMWILMVCWIASQSVEFSDRQRQAPSRRSTTTMALMLLNHNHSNSHSLQYQSDYGRGQHRLSASLSEGNIVVVVVQSGTWLVDSVQVGNGSDPYFVYALTETIQLVWRQIEGCERFRSACGLTLPDALRFLRSLALLDRTAAISNMIL